MLNLIKITLRRTMLTFKFFIALIQIIRRPEDLSPIFRVGAFRSHQSFQYALIKLKSDINTRSLMEERYLAQRPYNLEELYALPPNTLGYYFARHMKHFNLKVVFYPNEIRNYKDELNWFRQRARETHDIWHTITGYPADILGEMGLSSFYLAQTNSPLSAALIGATIVGVLIRRPHMLFPLLEVINKGWNDGVRAKPLFGIKWEEEWETPIMALREKYNIQVKDESYAVASFADVEAHQKDYFKNLDTIS